LVAPLFFGFFFFFVLKFSSCVFVFLTRATFAPASLLQMRHGFVLAPKTNEGRFYPEKRKITLARTKKAKMAQPEVFSKIVELSCAKN
jgi:hypothetical protein